MPDAVGSYRVTPSELAGLATAMSRIGAELDGTADLVHDCTPALGSDLVGAALHHFVTGWRDGRKQICAEIDALSQMLSQASTTYGATDSELAAAIPAS
jgi:hypothetical protein